MQASALVPFAGSVAKLSLPSIDIARIRSGGQTVRRTRRLLATTRDDIVLVNIQRCGASRLSQSGRDAILHPGDLALYSSSRPCELDFDSAFEQTVLLLSRDVLPEACERLEAVSATPIGAASAAAQLLGRLADALFDTSDRLDGPLNATLENALLQAILAALRVDARKADRTRLADFHLARIRAFVADHLHDPQLSVSMIAQQVGLSPTHLHRLFEEEPDTLMGWVLARRLSRCARDLRIPLGETRSISQIAFSHGFSDMSHFSRAFRRRFGVSARQYRAGEG